MPGANTHPPEIRWHQLELLPPSLTECYLRITAHGPSGTAMVSVRVMHGEPSHLVMQELYTSLPLADVESHTAELLRQMWQHELDGLAPF